MLVSWYSGTTSETMEVEKNDIEVAQERLLPNFKDGAYPNVWWWRTCGKLEMLKMINAVPIEWLEQ